jgi:hypothetical protein
MGRVSVAVIVALASNLGSGAGPGTQSTVPERVAKPRVVSGYGRLPLRFERNEGQVDERVRYLARGPGYTMFVTPTAMVLSLRKGVERPRAPRLLANEIASKPMAASVLRVKLLNAGSDVVVEGLEELPGKTNYFIGNDPKKWRTSVPSFARVRCRGVYPGIDLVYYGNQGQLEYDFVVAPGADPRRIRLGVEGARGLRLDGEGNLVVGLEGGDVVHRAPVVHQEFASRREAVSARWVLRGESEAGFDVGAYDSRQALIIDPVLGYSTYLGGSGIESAESARWWRALVAVDSNGSAYVTGYTASTDFPTLNPIQLDHPDIDVFVTKLSPSGETLEYSTYLGGDSGEQASGIAVDHAGSAYVSGFTISTDFPLQNPYQTHQGSFDAFIAKLSPSGNSLTYSTYLGGSDVEYGEGIAVDAQGSAHVTGHTRSSDFPLVNPRQNDERGGDAFVTRLSPLGNALLYSTYLGGGDYDYGVGIALDVSGSAYVTGLTNSSDFPILSPYQTDRSGSDAFVTKLPPDGGSLTYSTYLGGAGRDFGHAIAVDATESAYVVGWTDSTDFPLQNPYQTQGGVFVSKLSPVGNSLVYSTRLGGSQGLDVPTGVAVDGLGRAYVTGFTHATDFPTQDPIQTDQGLEDAFVTKLWPSGNGLEYSTYLGGDFHDTGQGIAVDRAGSAYVTGWTDSTSFPTRNPYQPVAAGAYDAFVTKLEIPPPPPRAFFAVTPCRVIDTRNAAGDLGGPALNAAADRTFTLVGPCDIPPTARAVAVNIAVTAPTKAGYLQLYPAGTAPPSTSSINYSAGQTRANNAVVTLNTSGAVTVHCVQASGTTHFILDVSGYFE